MAYMGESIKALSVDGTAPTIENVASKKYPIAREVFWYASTEKSQVISKIVEFALSPEGQSIVAEEGIVPAEIIKIKQETACELRIYQTWRYLPARVERRSVRLRGARWYEHDLRGRYLAG